MSTQPKTPLRRRSRPAVLQNHCCPPGGGDNPCRGKGFGTLELAYVRQPQPSPEGTGLYQTAGDITSARDHVRAHAGSVTWIREQHS